jgi:probable phosphoglycerate mutase
MTTIFLIRHGEIPRSDPRRFIGSTDLPLTPLGREQMARLADFLVSRQISRVFCSPLCRSLESAEILCRRVGGAAQTAPDLREISLGAWEGLSVDEVRERFPGSYEARGLDLQGFRPPGGESFSDLLRRVRPVFEKIAGRRNERVAVVAHAGVNRVLLCRLLGMPLNYLFKLGQDYGCLNTLRYGKNGHRVESINCIPS